jgi:splicing factor U2AF subunit
MDPEVTQIACAGLNDMQVGDKTLTVRTALSAGGILPPDFAQNNMAGSNHNPNQYHHAMNQNVVGTTMMQAATSAPSVDPNVDTILAQLQKHQALPMQIVPSVPLGSPSRIIVLLNMVF